MADYVPSHGNTMRLDDRDDTSGARVLDGEDQGKIFIFFINFELSSQKLPTCEPMMLTLMFRSRCR